MNKAQVLFEALAGGQHVSGPACLRARHWGQSCLAVPAQGGQEALNFIKHGYFFLLVACFFFFVFAIGGSGCAMQCKPEGL